MKPKERVLAALEHREPDGAISSKRADASPKRRPRKTGRSKRPRSDDDDDDLFDSPYGK